MKVSPRNIIALFSFIFVVNNIGAATVSYSMLTPTSMTISWSGSSTNVMVVLRAGGNPTNPSTTSTSPYTASSNFTSVSASDLGSGSKVVFWGNGSSVNVFNLTAATNYYVEVYNFVAPNPVIFKLFYDFTLQTSGSRYTLTNQPSVAASGLNVNYITPTTAKISLTKGTGANRLITIKQAATNTDLPADGSYYYPINVYGGGTIIGGAYTVYGGTGDTLTVTGLVPSTTYTFAVFEYNFLISSFTSNYLTSSYPTRTFSTPAAEPTAYTSNIVLTNVSATEATVNWITPAGGGANKLIAVKQGLMNKTALAFDGIDDYVKVPHTAALNAGTASFTLEAWVKTSATGTQTILSKRNTTTYSTGFLLGTANGFPYFEVTGTATGLANSCTGTATRKVNDGKWHHVALSVNRTSNIAASLYIDGNLDQTKTVAISTSINNTNDLEFGTNGGTTFFNGQLDEIRVWSTARSQSNIQNNMNEHIGGNLTGLVGLWRFNEGDVGASTAANSCTNTAGIDGSLVGFTYIYPAEDFFWISGWCYSGSGVGAPADLTTYTSNANFGAGTTLSNTNFYIVYTGTGNSVTIKGLSPGNTYQLCAYDYNGTASTNFNYLTNEHALRTFTTPAVEPTTPASALTFTSITPTSANVSWTNGNGTSRVVIAKPGKEQTALAFDGINDSVRFTNQASFNTLPLVVSAWIKTTQKDIGYFNIVSKYKIGSYNGYMLYISGGSVHGFYGKDISNYTWISNNTTDSIADGKWHHVTFAVSTTGSKIYIDGALRSTATWTGTGVACTTTEALTMGRFNGGGYYKGQIDEVTLWNNVPSDNAVLGNRNKSLIGDEAGLIGYWPMDDGSATTTTILNKAKASAPNGTLYNFASTTNASNFTNTSGWVYSGAQVNQPLDFASYLGNANYATYYSYPVGKYYVVYAGTGNSFTINGLSPATTYNLEVVEASVAPSTTEYNYATDSYLTGNLTTTAATVPSITSFNPATGPQGTIVTINGVGFSTTVADNIVYFGNSKAIVTAATANQLTAIVPSGDYYRPITVTVNKLVGASKAPFITTQNCAGSINSTSFNFTTSTTVSGTTVAETFADFNRDGLLDLISLDNANSRFSIFTNAGTSGNVSFNLRTNTTTASDPIEIAAEDIDGDGFLDVIVACKNTNRIQIFRSSGRTDNFITFHLPVELLTLNAPVSIAPADFDKDGKIDIAIGYNNDSISFFKNISSVANIEFSSTRIDRALPVGTTTGRIVAVDLDEDASSLPDIAVACSGTTNISVFRNTSTVGAINFGTIQNFNPGIGSSLNAIAAGRLSNDTKPDLAIAYGASGVYAFKNQTTTIGNIQFNTSGGATLSALSNTPIDIALNDIDGDGAVDIGVGYSNGASGTRVSVFENTSDANIIFSARKDYTIAGTAASNSVTIADINNDGMSDFIASSNTAAVNILVNEIAGSLSGEPASLATFLNVTNLSTTSATLNWTNGAGANRIVIVRPVNSSTTNITPFDGIDYSAIDNIDFSQSTSTIGGGCKVVYAGNANTVNITGLLSNTTYSFAVYEYNGTTCSINYLVSGAKPLTFTTLNLKPTINSIASPAAICQNATTQTINLSGITDGGEGGQTITLTATSSNTSIIPSVNVNYTSPGSTGTLTYTPVTGQSGNVTITVIIDDNASNNDTIRRTFNVRIDAPPTTANAGKDSLICGTAINLYANKTTIGSGAWSIISSKGPITLPSPANSFGASVGTFATIGDSVRLRWTISNGACAASTDDVIIKRKACPLSANFIPSNTAPCEGVAVNFADASTSSGSTITSWNWTFQDGTPATSTLQNPTGIVFTGSGAKTVTLTVQDNLAASNIKVIVVNVGAAPTMPSSITGPVGASVCAGVTGIPFTAATVSNAIKYNWTVPSGATIVSGDTTSAIMVDFAANAISGQVSVTAQNSCGTSAAKTYTLTVNPQVAAAGAITGNFSVCEGATAVAYSVGAISNAASYSWTLPSGAVQNSGGTSNSITVNYPTGVSVSGNIKVKGVSASGCSDGAETSEAVEVKTVPTAPSSITGNTELTICPLSTGVSYFIQSIANATSYTWTVPQGFVTAGNTTGTSISVDLNTSAVSGGNITVAGVNTCGTGATSTLQVNLKRPLDQQICIATPDTISKYNEVVWEKSITNDIDTFLIYREVAGLGWTKVGAISYDSLSKFVDSLFIPKADPKTTYYKYKIGTMDSCGNISDYINSTTHKTMFLQTNMGLNGAVNLSWNEYEGAQVSMYRIMLDSTNSGKFTPIDSTTSTVYTDYPNVPSNASLKYRIETIWNVGCTAPTLKTANTVKALSNIKPQAFVLSSITSYQLDKDVTVYPNPANKFVQITLPDYAKYMRIALKDIVGQEVLPSINSSTLKTLQFNLDEIASGIYFIEIRNAQINIQKKLIVQ